jgi:hypothetical protein
MTANWHTPETVRKWWSGAPVDNAVITPLLAIAKRDVLTFRPLLPAEDPDADPAGTLPDEFPYAQYRRARELWESQKASPNGTTEDAGIPGYQVRVTRLSWEVKAILRPDSGTFTVG